MNPDFFYNCLCKTGLEFYTGVPDSILSSFCLFLERNLSKNHHIVAANEGGALSIASGYHLGTGRLAVVYLQNSGLGNLINPLLSLADPKVYGIPMLMIIGWRGEPGRHDEPQHNRQGEITLALLDNLGIPYKILQDNIIESQLSDLYNQSIEQKRPVALIVRQGTLENSVSTENNVLTELMSREQALIEVCDSLNENFHIVSTTGKLSRELYDYRNAKFQSHDRDFLVVGSMGHSMSIALGLAISRPDKQIVCLDGDGSFLMHMGSAAIIGSTSPKNLIHLIFNNGSHESVGGIKTAADHISIVGIAKSCGYSFCQTLYNRQDIRSFIASIKNESGPYFAEIRTSICSRKNLIRPPSDLKSAKHEFMSKINK